LKNHKGITLIELLIIVVIIGTLAVLAVPRFMDGTMKSRQFVAKATLLEIAIAEQDYFFANGYYADLTVNCVAGEQFPTLGYTIRENTPYSFTIMPTRDGCSISAKADLDDDGAWDWWSITPGDTPVCVENDLE